MVEKITIELLEETQKVYNELLENQLREGRKDFMQVAYQATFIEAWTYFLIDEFDEDIQEILDGALENGIDFIEWGWKEWIDFNGAYWDNFTFEYILENLETFIEECEEEDL